MTNSEIHFQRKCNPVNKLSTLFHQNFSHETMKLQIMNYEIMDIQHFWLFDYSVIILQNMSRL